MSKKIQAVYKNGVFQPCQPVDVEDGETVTLVLKNGLSSAPVISDAEREQVRQRLTKRLLSNKVSENAPYLKREDLYD